MLISIPLFIVSCFIEGFDRYKWFVWGGVWALCILLGFVAPLKTGKSSDSSGEKDKKVLTSEQKKDKASSAARTASAAKTGEKNSRTAGKAPTVTSTPAEGVRPPQKKRTLEEALKELDEMVGLADVKEEIHKLVDYTKIVQARKKQGLKAPSLSYHCVFTGNPGTGKTTVARILAKVFKALGILEKGHLVETDRSGLVAKYVGQTAAKTNEVIDSALGGVLFIDE
ncbi:MAG: AAA family ATPase, partial [Lentisphaeria bacterium]|nr:AAA family ATPase [Lentisphaeria bacterium]